MRRFKFQSMKKFVGNVEVYAALLVSLFVLRGERPRSDGLSSIEKSEGTCSGP